MATVTFDIVRKIVEREGLDRLDAWGDPGKKSGKVCDAQTHDEVLAALDMLQTGANGAVFIEAWKGAEKKGQGYAWAVGNLAPMVGGGIAGNGIGGGYLERYFDTKLELELLKRDKESGNSMGDLHKTMLAYLPVIAKSMGVKLPRQPIAGDDQDDEEEEVPPGGIGEDEMEGMLDQVVAFARKNPEQARAYMASLKTQM